MEIVRENYMYMYRRFGGNELEYFDENNVYDITDARLNFTKNFVRRSNQNMYIYKYQIQKIVEMQRIFGDLVCEYCGVNLENELYNVDFITPPFLFKKKIRQNIAICCDDCMRIKDYKIFFNIMTARKYINDKKKSQQ